MIHLTPQQISSFLDDELGEASVELVRLHLSQCEECTLTFARAEEQSLQLSRTLRHDPGEEFFDVFADDVEERIRTGKVEPKPKTHASPRPPKAVAAEFETAPPEIVTPAQSTPTPAESAGPDPPEAPRAEPVDPAPEPAPAASPATPEPAGVEAPSARPIQPVRRLRRRDTDRRAIPAVPWYVAAILVVIAGSVGVMVSRNPLLERPAPAAPTGEEARTAKEDAPNESAPVAKSMERGASESTTPVRAVDAPTIVTETGPEPRPEQPTPTATRPIPRTPVIEEPRERSAEVAADGLVPESMKSLMPVTRTVTVIETTRVAAAAPERPSSLPRRSAAPPAEPDPFASLLVDLRDRVVAAQRGTAHANEDPTAANYESAAARWERVVSDLQGHSAQPRARFQLASARFRAWEMHPDPQRAAAAVASLRLQLVFAGPGAERDSARVWLARLSH